MQTGPQILTRKSSLKLPEGTVLPAHAIQPFQDEIHPLYWANLYASEKIVVNQGGTYSGKSECLIRVMFSYAINFPGIVITVATNTIPKLKEDALRIAKKVYEKNPKVRMFVKQYHATDRIFIFTNGSRIEFKSFENASAAHGEKRDILYLTEATRVSYDIFQQANLRTDVRVFLDYNPTSSFYVHKKILANKKEYPSVKVFRSWHEHNPYLDQEKHDEIERISDPVMHAVYARGITGILKGAIFSNWVQVDDFPYSDGVIWGTDWAFSKDKRADPTACTRIKRNPLDRPDLDYVIDQVCYGVGIDAHAVAQVQKQIGYKDGQPDYCDHATEQIYEKQLNGITGATLAIKGPGSILGGIFYMKRKKIGVTARSEAIWTEYNNYNFLEVEGIVTNTPIDEYNHAMDASRYAIYSDALIYGYV